MIFQRWFGRGHDANQAIVDALYETIVAAARQPTFYSHWGVPDSPLGRFEMVGLHMSLFLRRIRGETGAMAEIAQKLTDEFFLDIDHSIRELGISDPGVPKRMKKLARMHYGRAAAYGSALDSDDVGALADALRRNVWPDKPDWDGAEPLSNYVKAAATALRTQPSAALLSGVVHFPKAGMEE